MCFSATASFTVATGLIPLGFHCVRTVVRSDRAERLPLAVIPVFFGVQQILEGLVWIGIGQHSLEPFTHLASLAYLFFAYVFWLVWIPFACLRWSASHITSKRLVLLRLNLLMGALCGSLLWIPLLRGPDFIRAENQLGSINYNSHLLLDGVISQPLGRLIYVSIIVLPLLMTTDRRMISFAAALIAATIVSSAAYSHAFTSVWCYFSAIASAVTLWIISAPSDLEDSENPVPCITSL